MNTYHPCDSRGGGSRRILFVSSLYFGTYFASRPPLASHSSLSSAFTSKGFVKASESTFFLKMIFSVKRDRIRIHQWHVVIEVEGTK